MNGRVKRQPTRWESRAKRTGNRITERDRKAMLHEYELRMAAGAVRDVILKDMEAAFHRVPRQLERYLAAARQDREREIEERTLRLLQQGKVMIGRGKNAHHREIRRLAQLLEKELETPLSRDIFNISPGNRYWFPDRTSWTVADDGLVQVFLPLEKPGERQRLYHCLMEHLSASEISGVVERMEDWKGLVAKYLEACYRLLVSVRTDVETLFGGPVVDEYRDEPGVLIWFPATVCFDAVERAKKVRTTRGFEYRMETTLAGLSQLRFGAYAIAIARTPGECGRYRSEHSRLRTRWTASQQAKEIIPLYRSAAKAQKGIISDLQEFRQASAMQGHCHRCAPAPA